MKSNTGIYELILSVPWGNEASEIQPQFIDVPKYADESYLPGRIQYAPNLFRIGFSGNIHILENGYYETEGAGKINIVHYSNEGIYLFKTPLSNDTAISSREIIDFFVDEDLSCYLLEKYIPGNESQFYNRFYKTDKSGKIIWQQKGLNHERATNFTNLEGSFNKFLFFKDKSVFLSSDVELNSIGKFNAGNGAFEEVITFKDGSKYNFMGRDPEIIRVPYFSKNQHRGLSAFNYINHQTEIFEGDNSLIELLLFPFGADSLNSCYIYKTPVLASISFSGVYTEIEKVENMVISPDSAMIYTSYYENEKFYIKGFKNANPSGNWVFDIDESEDFKPKLILVDANSSFYILIRDSQKMGKYVVKVYSQEGFLKEDIEPLGKFNFPETTLAHFDFWNVDKSGRIYLQVSDPQGIKILRRSNN